MTKLLTCVFIAFSVTCAAQKQENFLINFDFDQYEITKTAAQKLDSCLQSDAGSIQKIDLYGYCDAIGNDLYNYQLSIKRAEAVKYYFLAKNIQQSIFNNLKGFGKYMPLNDNSDNEKRAVNRRVMIVIQRVDQKKTDVVETKIKKAIPADQQTLIEKIKDTATKTGTNIILNNLNFYGGTHRLMQHSIPVLKELLLTMQQYPDLIIEIQGHVCCEYFLPDGFDEETRTQNLSVNRARTIYDFLVDNSINPKRLSYKGLGNRYPLYRDDSEEHELLNRRVEIKIIKK